MRAYSIYQFLNISIFKGILLLPGVVWVQGSLGQKKSDLGFSDRRVVVGWYWKPPKTRPSKLCEFCIKSCAERRKMTAVN